VGRVHLCGTTKHWLVPVQLDKCILRVSVEIWGPCSVTGTTIIILWMVTYT